MPETAYVWRASADEPWTLLAGNIVVPGLGPDGDSLTLVDAHAHVAGWAVDERAERGVAAIDVPDRPSDPALVVTGHVIEEADGLPVWTWTTEPKGLEQVKAERLRAIEAAYDARRQRFPCVLGGSAEHLQLRDGSNDARNWMILQRRADRAIAAGHGAVTCPTPIRAESNAEHAATFQEIADLLEAMEDWGAGLMAVCWAKKDAVTAAETVEAVLAVDPATGWEA